MHYKNIILLISIFAFLFYFNNSYCRDFNIEFAKSIPAVNSDSIINDTIIEDGRRPRARAPRDTIIEDVFEPVEITETPEERDTIVEIAEELPQEEIDIEEDEVVQSPTKAAMLSATLPGLGQIYNRKYWKVPIIYAGLGAVGYFINFNNTEYQKWRKAYTYRVDGNPNTVDDFPNHSTEVLRRAMNYYRRNLEISYIAGGFIYLLGILDAVVDAHLMDFDVSEDLSINVQPGIIPGNYNFGMSRFSSGITLAFRF